VEEHPRVQRSHRQLARQEVRLSQPMAGHRRHQPPIYTSPCSPSPGVVLLEPRRPRPDSTSRSR
jgi:hypothetical protein